MHTSPIYLINTKDNFAQIDLFRGEKFETRYSYGSFLINLSERENDFSSNIVDLKENMDAIKIWISLVQKNLITEKKPLNIFTEEIKKKTNELEGKYISGGDILSDATYSHLSKDFVFNARAEIQIHFFDFIAWFHFLERFFFHAVTF